MSDLDGQLEQRLHRPQRHRLLQGYPALPQMSPATTLSTGVRTLRGALDTGRVASAERLALLEADLAMTTAATSPPADARAARVERMRESRRPQTEKAVAHIRASLALPDLDEPPFIDVDRSRDLIVGVIPHTQCTPRVDGCGFCTFPHEAADKRSRADVVVAVENEISAILQRERHARGRKVAAIYFGGGTANLAKPEQIAALFGSLARSFDVADAELSLEGIPALFSTWFHAPLKMLDGLKVRQRRISMGIQTFDGTWIERMGRTAFGDERSIRKLVARCQSMNITTSGDFLFNLPGQSLAAMTDDVDRAITAGLDQICLYNLVLYEGLGTQWSKDPALVAAMPDNETACAHWLSLRAKLLAAGFVQTTLTNFERADVANGDRAFVYERASFSPEKTDAIGFGPMSLSMFVDTEKRRAVKLLRRKNLRSTPWSGDDLCSLCEGDDLRLLFVTRSLAKGSFDRSVYAGLCGSAVEQDFPGALALLARRGLIEVNAASVALTPRGMFFSDAVVSTFIAEKAVPRHGAGVHTQTALAEPTLVAIDYDGMG